ncbi:MAG TPA: hypothetical protein VHY37_09440, partial [Tepidisphaeraceae bacterium]|nr:hypothetical protein [Tepidisphaeraceae bacterium]
MSSASASNSPSPSAAPRRRRRGWRWALYALGGIAVLLVLLICIVQILLWSSTPRNIVMSLIEQKLGLGAGADTLDTTWWGRTTLRNVHLALPLAAEPFVKIPLVTVRTRWLVALALTGNPGLRSIELDHPTLSIHRDALGRWNLQDVIDMIASAVGSAGSSPSSGAVPIPAIIVNGATVNISDATGRSVSIGPVNIHGTPRSSVTWQFTVSVPDHLTADGMLAPGGSWRQEVNVEAHDVAPWIAPWFDRLPANTRVAAHWLGQMTGSSAGPSLTGLLMLHDLTAAKLRAEGIVDASVGPDGVTMHPRTLALLTPSTLLPRINVIGGAITYANNVIAAQSLSLQLMNGPAKLTASYNVSAGTGRLD